MSIAICIECKKRYRAHEGDGGRCRFCAEEVRESERMYRAQAAHSIRLFGTDDEDVIAGKKDA